MRDSYRHLSTTFTTCKDVCMSAKKDGKTASLKHTQFFSIDDKWDMSTFPTPRTCLPDRLHVSNIFTCTWIRLEMKVPLETCSFQTQTKIMAVVTFRMAKDTTGPWTIEKGDSIANWQQQQTWATKHKEMFQTQRFSGMTHLNGCTKDSKHIRSFTTGLSLSRELQQHETASDDSWTNNLMVCFHDLRSRYDQRHIHIIIRIQGLKDFCQTTHFLTMHRWRRHHLPCSIPFKCVLSRFSTVWNRFLLETTTLWDPVGLQRFAASHTCCGNTLGDAIWVSRCLKTMDARQIHWFPTRPISRCRQNEVVKRGGKKCFMIANMRYGQSSVSVDGKDMSTLPNHVLLQIQIQGTP